MARFCREESLASAIMESARDSNGNEYLRKKGSDVIYKEMHDEYRCMNCDSPIRVANVAHPIHDGSPSSLSGSGRCYYEEVPYCPTCEKTPRSSGCPIQI